jgi:hypothetical protein
MDDDFEYTAIPPLYVGQNEDGDGVFNDFINSNQLAVVGETGWGKTTIMRYLAHQAVMDTSLTVRFFEGRTADEFSSPDSTGWAPDGVHIFTHSAMELELTHICTRMHDRLRHLWGAYEDGWQVSKREMSPELIMVDDYRHMSLACQESIQSIKRSGPATGFYLVISGAYVPNDDNESIEILGHGSGYFRRKGKLHYVNFPKLDGSGARLE